MREGRPHSRRRAWHDADGVGVDGAVDEEVTVEEECELGVLEVPMYIYRDRCVRVCTKGTGCSARAVS